jgi:hypothetical protein
MRRFPPTNKYDDCSNITFFELSASVVNLRNQGGSPGENGRPSARKHDKRERRTHSRSCRSDRNRFLENGAQPASEKLTLAPPRSTMMRANLIAPPDPGPELEPARRHHTVLPQFRLAASPLRDLRHLRAQFRFTGFARPDTKHLRHDIVRQRWRYGAFPHRRAWTTQC